VRHTFQTKLLSILAIATCAFVMMIVVGAKLAERADDQLSRISRDYIPRLELGPRLTGRFESLVRGFRDAVAAQDREALHATRSLRDACLRELERARALVPPADAEALRLALEGYDKAARELSLRMLDNETGEDLVAAIDEMQAKQRRAETLLAKTTSFDQTALTRAFAAATAAQSTASQVRLIISACGLTLVMLLCFWLSRSLLRALREIGAGFSRFGRGDFASPIRVLGNDEFGELARQANEMAGRLNALKDQRDHSDWLTTGLGGLVLEVRGELEPEVVAERAARYLARYLGAPAAALYWPGAGGELSLLGQYAALASAEQRLPQSVAIGAGLLGQSAREQDITIVDDLPEDYFPLRSSLGSARPRTLVFLPLSRQGQTAGVLELAALRPWSAADNALLLSVRESLTIAIEVARARASLRSLLAETQQQAARLRLQEDELRSNNEELQSQQDELLDANTALTQQASELVLQRRSLELSNMELQEVRRTLEQKAHELTAVSAFKSQFLANMSHELRTPLNSMLILSSLLAEHEAGVLTDKQTEFCRTIHGAARDLLALINQVLDLAKVESGKQAVELSVVRPSELVDYARRMFEPQAQKSQLRFTIELEQASLPETISTDRRKLEQVLNNLLGNAIKFTAHGGVTLRIAANHPSLEPRRAELHGVATFVISVADTGSGIPRAHRERIFAPFEQLEGTSDRRYGGTGLGLSIARELVGLLGGELCLESEEGRGSEFVCFLPQQCRAASASASAAQQAPAPRLQLVPQTALLPSTRPAEKPPADPRRILIVEDEQEVIDVLSDRLGGNEFELVIARTARDAREQLSRQTFRCVVLDLGLPDLDGLTLLGSLHEQHRTSLPPVLVHTGRALDKTQLSWLEAHAEVVVLKQGLAVERLVDEIRLLLRRLDDGQTHRPRSGTIVPAARTSLTGRKLLVADDDMRTVYALSALLRAKGVELLVADTGRAAVAMLDANPDVELVLMDIMMPEMDGYEATRRIRQDARFATLPIVALTAKAMKNDRDRCLEAGASDYLPKPIEADLLFAMIGAQLAPGTRAGAPVSTPPGYAT
jgi:two-component system chemotaxis sensor kinase CheA